MQICPTIPSSFFLSLSLPNKPTVGEDFRIFPPADPNLAPENYSVFDFRIDTESFPGRVLIGAA